MLLTDTQADRKTSTKTLTLFLISKAGLYVGFYFEGGLKIRGGERRGPKGRSPRPERPRAGVGFLVRGHPAPSPPARGSGERFKLPQRGPGRNLGRPSGLLHFVDARWLFLAFQRLLAKHQRPHIMQHVIFIQWKKFLVIISGGLNP